MCNPSDKAIGSTSAERARLCEKFEAELNAGCAPVIEDYLREGSAGDRQALLAELLIREIRFRKSHGDSLKPEAYLDRFIGESAVVLKAFQAAGEPYEDDLHAPPSAAFPTTQGKDTDAGTAGGRARTTPSEEPVPERIGRYRVQRLLGQGGFGRVYLAVDDELERRVAIKVPHVHRLETEDIETYLSEARIAAQLDHPGIVPVYDVGRSDDGSCYVVSKYVEGTTLARRIGKGRLSHEHSVALVHQVALALHHAHANRLVHRDVKPGNILLDAEEKPYVADFGLAIREADFGTGHSLMGTPPYMSPEQARREGHLVDGRSDVFSLGVVFYELLTGVRPFTGRGTEEILSRIRKGKPRPPRQLDATIPKELERICLKALAKFVQERYTTAHDLAEDLARWEAEDPSRAVGVEPPASSTASQPVASAPRVVPKGLRSFDANDADFFLKLLPGPYDRDGLPESVRFWKTKIEETDPDTTFRVGLMYGPSGCGKSSLVRSGVLPHLEPHVATVYVEAAPHDTERRILKRLHRLCPDLKRETDLANCLAHLRQGQGLSPERKLLIVIDQLEQWLHEQRGDGESPLTLALRQCDGERVQCLVMVRDDFWMAATRFLHALDVTLIERENCAPSDLFDIPHARAVLAEFGQAYGALPGDLTSGQEQFVELAIQGLSQNERVVPVRLSLFAEMVKGKPWTPETLTEIGGAEGVGRKFLEETFDSPHAPPPHRLHKRAIRAILAALLPAEGSELRGALRSRDELLQASGYADSPEKFDAVMQILDAELRILTPTDPEGFENEADRPVAAAGNHYYQLTHDYLVPPIRNWLHLEQMKTRRGRAALKLAERASLWNARRERKQLPSLREWLAIRLLTDKKEWTKTQREMMAKTDYRYGLWLVLLVAMLSAGVVTKILWERSANQSNARSLYAALIRCKIENANGVVAEIGPHRRYVNPLLREGLEDAKRSQDDDLQLRFALALLRPDNRTVDRDMVDLLYQLLLEAGPEEAATIRAALNSNQDRLMDRVWGLLHDPEEPKQVLPAAAFAAPYTFDDAASWAQVSKTVVESLLEHDPETVRAWAERLKSVSEHLRGALAPSLRGERGSAKQKVARTIEKVWSRANTNKVRKPNHAKATIGDTSSARIGRQRRTIIKDR